MRMRRSLASKAQRLLSRLRGLAAGEKSTVVNSLDQYADWFALRRLIFWVALATACLIAALVYWFDNKSALEVEAMHNASIVTVQKLISQRLEQFDNEGVVSIATVFLEREYVNKLLVVDRNQDVVFGDYTDMQAYDQVRYRHYKVTASVSGLNNSTAAADAGGARLEVLIVRPSVMTLLGRSLLVGTVAFMLILGGCLLAVHYYTKRYILSPVKNLNSAIHRTLQSGVHEKVGYSSNSLLGQLANRFDMMQDQLQASQAHQGILLRQKEQVSRSLQLAMRQQEKDQRHRAVLLASLREVLAVANQVVGFYDQNGQLIFLSRESHGDDTIRSFLSQPSFIVEQAQAYFSEHSYSSVRISTENQPAGTNRLLYFLEIVDSLRCCWTLQAMRLDSGDRLILVSNITELRETQRNFTHTQKMDSLGELVGGVAHEFNNMLAIISGNLQLIAHEVKGMDSVSSRMESSQIAANRAAKTVAQLLVYSRRVAVQAEQFNLRSRLDGLAEMLNNIIEPHIKLTIQVRTQHSVCVNSDLFDSAIIALVANACDAILISGCVVLIAEAVTSDELQKVGLTIEKPFVVIRVEDTGSGIKPEIIDRVFDPFFTTKQIGQGVGLGLSAVYGFARQSAGRITCSSVLGSGSTFNLYLPALTSAADAQMSTSAQQLGQSAGQLAPASCGNKMLVASQIESQGNQARLRVLVVDDEKLLLQPIKLLLSNHGCEVDLASTILEATAKISQNLYDVVLCDVHMPDGKGLTVIEKARQMNASCRLMLMSGNMVDCPDCVDHVLAKPFDLSKLLELLELNPFAGLQE